MINSNTLNSLFLFRNGENKGFAKLMQDKQRNKEYEDAFVDVIRSAFGDAFVDMINELYSKCSESDVDADVQQLVDKLYEINGGVDE